MHHAVKPDTGLVCREHVAIRDCTRSALSGARMATCCVGTWAGLLSALVHHLASVPTVVLYCRPVNEPIMYIVRVCRTATTHGVMGSRDGGGGGR
jgi:hypothetical protein